MLSPAHTLTDMLTSPHHRRPLFYLTRTDGHRVPMIPVDVLPPDTDLRGFPSSLPERPGPRWVHVGTCPHADFEYEHDHDYEQRHDDGRDDQPQHKYDHDHGREDDRLAVRHDSPDSFVSCSPTSPTGPPLQKASHTPPPLLVHASSD